MSTAKPVKKTLNFSSEEQDQMLLTRADETVASGNYASFNELAKTALQRLLAPDAAQSPVDDQRGDERLTVIEERLGELVTAQKALTTTVQALRDATTQSTEATRAHEAEHLAALDRTLLELHTTLHQQGETLLTELQTFRVQSTPSMLTQADAQPDITSMESRMRLARFLEDF